MSQTLPVQHSPTTAESPEPGLAAWWSRLGRAALLFYCLKGLAWLAIGWMALGNPP